MIISYNIPNHRHHQIHLPHPLPPAKSIRAPLLHQQSWSPYISHIIMIILPTLHVAPSRSPRCSSGGASRAKWNSTPSSWTGCSPSHILHTYAMRFLCFLGSSMAWCLGKAYNPRCHQGMFQPPFPRTTEARWQKAHEAHPKGAARKRPHPSLRSSEKSRP